MHIANYITLLRIVLIPIFIGVFYLPIAAANQIAASLFSVAVLTDGLDGYIARQCNRVSPFGAWLDPVADKLIVISALILLITKQPYPALVIPSILITTREIAVSGLREWMAILGSHAVVKVSWLGKAKTFTQMLGITLLFYNFPESIHAIMQWIGYNLLYISSFFSIASLTDYLISAKRHFAPKAD